MRVFHTARGHAAHPLMATAEAVFQLEKEIRDKQVDSVDIAVRAGRLSTATGESISRILNDLISYVLVEDVNFRFIRGTPPPVKKLRTEIDLEPTAAICLFSGGLDSVVGISLATSMISAVDAVFCAHSDQSNAIRIVEQLDKLLLRRLGVRLRKMHVSSIQKRGYAQTRGFLYALMAAAWIQLLDATTLIITEVGPTMYQPRFALLDKVTFTTHPVVVHGAQLVIEELLQRPLKVITPFENLTKAEVFSLAPADLPLHRTHSCISQRFGDHDGTCYGCVVRRLAGIAVGRRDVVYKRNPLIDPHASRGNLTALLRFNRDCLDAMDQMEEYEIGDIIRYRKQDLFERFALDNFAAIHSLVASGKKLVEEVNALYISALAVLGGTRPLEDRLVRLRRGGFVPAF